MTRFESSGHDVTCFLMHKSLSAMAPQRDSPLLCTSCDDLATSCTATLVRVKQEHKLSCTNHLSTAWPGTPRTSDSQECSSQTNYAFWASRDGMSSFTPTLLVWKAAHPTRWFQDPKQVDLCAPFLASKVMVPARTAGKVAQGGLIAHSRGFLFVCGRQYK